MSHVVLSTIIFILLVTKTSSSPLDTTMPTQSQSEPSIDRVKNSKSIVLSLSVIAIVLIVSILAYVSLRNLEKLKPFISRTKMYLSFSSNIRRKNNNFSFLELKLNTRLQSTGRNDLENLLNEKHNHGLQPSLPVSKLTTINTSSSKPFKLLPINFDIDADIFNIFLHQKSRQMFSISRWTAISDVVSPSHFQHNWLLPHPRFYREARHR